VARALRPTGDSKERDLPNSVALPEHLGRLCKARGVRQQDKDPGDPKVNNDALPRLHGHSLQH